MVSKLLFYLTTAEDIQKHYHFLYGQFQDSEDKKRYEELKNQIKNIEKNMLTMEKNSIDNHNSSYRIGMEYLTTAIISTNVTEKRKYIKKSFDHFTEVIAIYNNNCQKDPEYLQNLKDSYDLKMELTVSYWARYIYFCLEKNKGNILRQVFEGVKISPSFSLMLFPPDFFYDEELKMKDMEMEIIQFQKNHNDMKKLNETVRHFGSFYYPSEVSTKSISILKVYDRLDQIDSINKSMTNRAIQVLQNLQRSEQYASDNEKIFGTNSPLHGLLCGIL